MAAIKRRVKPEMTIVRDRRRYLQATVDAFARDHDHLFSYQVREAIRSSYRVNSALNWEKPAIRDLKQAVIKCLKRYGVESKLIKQ